MQQLGLSPWGLRLRGNHQGSEVGEDFIPTLSLTEYLAHFFFLQQLCATALRFPSAVFDGFADIQPIRNYLQATGGASVEWFWRLRDMCGTECQVIMTMELSAFRTLPLCVDSRPQNMLSSLNASCSGSLSRWVLGIWGQRDSLVWTAAEPAQRYSAKFVPPVFSLDTPGILKSPNPYPNFSSGLTTNIQYTILFSNVRPLF